jgi:hypothetical protein
MMFSKSRLVSIGLLLAILFISLTFTSYVEGLENASIVDIVNKDAPKTPQSTDAKASAKASATASATDATDAKTTGVQATGVQATGVQATGVQAIDGVTLGKPLTVADITGVLQNNPGVQKLLDKSL